MDSFVVDQVKERKSRDCWVDKKSLFYPLDIKQDRVRFEPVGDDVFNSSLTREQIWFIDLLETDQIFCPQICKSKTIATMEVEYRERFKKLLLEKVLGGRDIGYQLSCLDFTFLNGVLGYDCK